jgi:predicted DNA-binding transcriptional regulator YafY
MQVKNAVGQGAPVLKYDILSALLVLAAQGDTTESRLALRLSLLITARYSWQRKRFNVGLRELARMWGVTERTAKRDMAQMRALNWITVTRAAARGRVTEHTINVDIALRATMPFWDCVGPDFTARLSQTPQSKTDNIVQFHAPAAAPQQDETLWSSVAQRLHASDPQTYQAWFARILQIEQTDTRLVLAAPTAFIANYINLHFGTSLLAHVAGQDRGIKSVQIIAAS